MMKIQLFIITIKTVAIFPVTNEQGELHAIVLHDGVLYYVPVSPLKIIQFNLRIKGMSYRGAKDRAALLVGSSSMSPVVIDEHLRLVFLPSEASKNETCAWFALHFINKMEPLDKGGTLIRLHGTKDFIIDIPYGSFRNRWQVAHILRSQLLDSVQDYPFSYGVSRTHIFLVSDGYRVTYRIEKEEK